MRSEASHYQSPGSQRPYRHRCVHRHLRRSPPPGRLLQRGRCLCCERETQALSRSPRRDLFCRRIEVCNGQAEPFSLWTPNQSSASPRCESPVSIVVIRQISASDPSRRSLCCPCCESSSCMKGLISRARQKYYPLTFRRANDKSPRACRTGWRLCSSPYSEL